MKNLALKALLVIISTLGLGCDKVGSEANYDSIIGDKIVIPKEAHIIACKTGSSAFTVSDLIGEIEDENVSQLIGKFFQEGECSAETASSDLTVEVIQLGKFHKKPTTLGFPFYSVKIKHSNGSNFTYPDGDKSEVWVSSDWLLGLIKQSPKLANASQKEKYINSKLSPKLQYLITAFEEGGRKSPTLAANLSLYKIFGQHGLTKNTEEAINLIEFAYKKEKLTGFREFWKATPYIIAAYYYSLDPKLSKYPFIAEAHSKFQNFPMATGWEFLCKGLREGSKSQKDADDCLVSIAKKDLNLATFAYFHYFETLPSRSARSEAATYAVHRNDYLIDKEVRRPVIIELVETGIDLSFTLDEDYYGNGTILHGALKNSDFELANYLVSKGASVKNINRDKDSSILIALNSLHKESPKHKILEAQKFIRTAVESGLELNNVFDEQGYSPIMIAARHGITSIVDILLEHGANPITKNTIRNGKDIEELNGIDQAIRYKNVQLEAVFNKHGFSVEKEFDNLRKNIHEEEVIETKRVAEAEKIAATHPYIAEISCNVGYSIQPIYGCLKKYGSIVYKDELKNVSYSGIDLMYNKKLEIPLTEKFVLQIQNGEGKYSRIDVHITDIVTNKLVYNDRAEGPYKVISVQN
ncbi:ankyrin repeat domain-containing protein [Microbulbifer variabilis]|uniref:ankyrin repeat domain-containing protein n=1 Tax=Microbulbifer variabilis TaxID=266805 RepID=UPI001CFECE29|nr:ankyrin repeat domain-containing protein [Microbulbifer variabilis]